MNALSDPWVPPAPPTDDELVIEVDPRVIQDHRVGVLPCPANPPPPVGWKYWKRSVRAGLVQLATEMLHDAQRFGMGAFVQSVIDGELIGARVEWHGLQGSTGQQGCFRGVNLMQPSP